MKSRMFFAISLCLVLGVGLIGCAQYITQRAIVDSRKYVTVEEQVDYLLSESNTLIKMEKFDSAINIAEYILKNLDPNSVEAKDIIKTAKAGLEEAELYRLIQPHYYFGDTAGVWKHKWWELGLDDTW